MPAPASLKGKVRYIAKRPEALVLNPIDPEWDESTQAWVKLLNCSIEVVQDLGIESFGGAKIYALREAIMQTMRAWTREDAKELMRIAVEHDPSEEAKDFVTFIRECLKRIPPEPEEQYKARKGKK